MALNMADRAKDAPFGRILLVLVCLYAPYAWLILIDYPWNSYRWLWIKMWPVLPGILVLTSRAIRLLPDWIGYLVMGAVTCGIVFKITLSAARGWQSAVIVSVLAALLSAANSWIAYRMFLF
jgi:hypothetical protein